MLLNKKYTGETLKHYLVYLIIHQKNFFNRSSRGFKKTYFKISLSKTRLLKKKHGNTKFCFLLNKHLIFVEIFEFLL